MQSNRDEQQLVPPTPAGLSWREVTADDLEAMVELADECYRADGGLAFLNEPGALKQRYFPAAPGRSTGAFASDGRLAACTTIHLLREPGIERAVIVGQVRPQFRNRGLGTFLMRWSKLQARALFTPGSGDERLLQIATESLTDSTRRLYHAHGYHPIFEELVMRRDLRAPLPDRPLPPGVTVADWEPALASQFFQAYEASFRDRPGFPGHSAEEWIGEIIEDDDAKPEWSLLARAGEAPIGFLTAATGHPDSFIVQVGVIPEHRRRGLGSALAVETMRRMQAAGETAVQLCVNVDNPGAIQAYVELGFTAAGRRARYERTAPG